MAEFNNNHYSQDDSVSGADYLLGNDTATDTTRSFTLSSILGWVQSNIAIPISRITSLQGSLDGKANTSHSHVIGDTTGLQTALDGKLNSTGSISSSQVSDFDAAVDTSVGINTSTGSSALVLAQNGEFVSRTPASGGITAVETDASISGDGTAGSALSVVESNININASQVSDFSTAADARIATEARSGNTDRWDPDKLGFNNPLDARANGDVLSYSAAADTGVWVSPVQSSIEASGNDNAVVSVSGNGQVQLTSDTTIQLTANSNQNTIHTDGSIQSPVSVSALGMLNDNRLVTKGYVDANSGSSNPTTGTIPVRGSDGSFEDSIISTVGGVGAESIYSPTGVRPSIANVSYSGFELSYTVDLTINRPATEFPSRTNVSSVDISTGSGLVGSNGRAISTGRQTLSPGSSSTSSPSQFTSLTIRDVTFETRADSIEVVIRFSQAVNTTGVDFIGFVVDHLTLIFTDSAIQINGPIRPLGGIALGGTTAANTLDDYEEGTWTPASSDVTLSAASGTYTKVGNLVSLNTNITVTNAIPFLFFDLGGLPFSVTGGGSFYINNESRGSFLTNSDIQINLNAPTTNSLMNFRVNYTTTA